MAPIDNTVLQRASYCLGLGRRDPPVPAQPKNRAQPCPRCEKSHDDIVSPGKGGLHGEGTYIGACAQKDSRTPSTYSSGCGRCSCRNDGTECASCCGAYQSWPYPCLQPVIPAALAPGTSPLIAHGPTAGTVHRAETVPARAAETAGSSAHAIAMQMWTLTPSSDPRQPILLENAHWRPIPLHPVTLRPGSAARTHEAARSCGTRSIWERRRPPWAHEPKFQSAIASPPNATQRCR